MKKILCIMLIIAMLVMMGCQTQAPAQSDSIPVPDVEESTATDADIMGQESSPQDIQESKAEAETKFDVLKYADFTGNSVEEEKKIAESYYFKYVDNTVNSVPPIQLKAHEYAIMLQPEDFPSIPNWQIERWFTDLPYNIGEGLSKDGMNTFLTPREFYEKEPEVCDTISRLAKIYVSYRTSSVIFEGKSEQEVVQMFEEICTPEFAYETTRSLFDDKYANSFTDASCPIAMPGLVYITSSCKLAARVLVPQKLISAEDDYLKSEKCDPYFVGKWCEYIIDMIFELDEESGKIASATLVIVTSGLLVTEQPLIDCYESQIAAS